MSAGDDAVIIELRTHGVSGTPPESMLNCSAVVQVSGDDTGRFFRAADTLGKPIWKVVPVEPDVGPDVTRYREGYHWGKMTSGGLKQALWGLLVPFALVNLAQWMVPPRASEATGWLDSAAIYILRGLVRLAGLGLTVVLVAQWAALVADVIAAQCLSVPVGATNCLKSWTMLDPIRGHPLPIAGFVLVAVALPVYGGSWITYQARKRIDPDHEKTADVVASPSPEEVEDGGAGVGPVPHIGKRDFYERQSSAPMRTLRGTVGLASGALVLSGASVALPGWIAHLVWYASIVLIGIGGLFAFCMDDPSSSGGRFHRGRWVAVALGGRSSWRRLVWSVGLVVLIVACMCCYLPTLDTPAIAWTGRLDPIFQWLFFGLAVLCALAVPPALSAARRSRTAYFGPGSGVPTVFRPWAWGIATAVILPFAGLLGAGLGVGMAETVRNCLRSSCKPALLSNPADDRVLAAIGLPRTYEAIALLWGITGVVVVVAVLVLLLGGPRYARKHGCFAAANLIQEDGRMWRTWFHAALKTRADLLLFGVVATAVTAGVISALVVPTGFMSDVVELPWIDRLLEMTGLSWFAAQTSLIAVLESLGVFVLALVSIGLLYAIYNASRRPDTAGRSLGVLWDMASFWPTEAHPFVPPCYARKAIDDLVKRVDRHRVDYPDANVVLCGHSQGSLVMYATVLRIIDLKGADSECVKHLGLVTHGSQLQWAYGRAFHDMLSYHSHLYVMETLKGRWQNLVRYTDPLGGAVLSWDLTADGTTLKATRCPCARIPLAERGPPNAALSRAARRGPGSSATSGGSQTRSYTTRTFRPAPIPTTPLTRSGTMPSHWRQVSLHIRTTHRRRASSRRSNPHAHLATAHFSKSPRSESVSLPSSASDMIARKMRSILPF